MTDILSATATRSAGEAMALCVYRPGDRVRTTTGETSAERLRPGDRIEGGAVLWFAMSRGIEGRSMIRVMLGKATARRAPAAPMMGRVSPETGRFERMMNLAPPRGAGTWVH
ncbi:hypothetical protein [Tropicimonas sp. IMCC6043]|uniref:hypothetical protein n=1 Tax=Tropicimonas sp. IMCC6043 TaxID=2510645 RepID=UPI00101D9031|nr:hypothetical protein [Tropicimonas sp. IMCC6043]RYH12184.1 hypothetical protein EU800_01065 [Tropicimonas sp. IMCC6043]